ncbi:MAG: TIGR02147 family protein [Bdellovibrionaceae bacterium]|nr:TIGR02147 family protein [Pseudobdellovibrionaceae bacterium]
MYYIVYTLIMNIFIFKTYKAFLADYIKRNKYKGLISKLAETCGCDRTYISQVLNGKADLLPDHIARLCEYLHFTELESDYLMLLLLKDRATSVAAKNIFEIKLKKINEMAEDLSQKVKSKKDSEEIISEEHKTLYYSNWLFSAIHILTSIANFQTIEAISKKMNCTEASVSQVLKLLVEMGLVEKSKDKYVHNGKSVYLRRDAAQIYSLHLQSRLESVKRSYEKNDLHFTNIFSVSKEDVDAIRNQIMLLIEQHRQTVHRSGAQTACVFCCDFFSI